MVPCRGSFYTDHRYFISSLAKRCIEIQPPCRDERQGNISIISVPRKKSMSWLCQLTSWSLVQRLTEHMLLACSLQRDPCISFSMKRFIIRHFSMLNTCVLVVLFSSFFFFLQKTCCTGYSGLVWRKIWHFVLSICPVSVVLGPVQVFAFCSSGDRCYNHYKAVVKCPAEHVRVSNGERQKVLCLFSPRSREDSSTLAEHAEAVQTRMGRLSAERWALHFIHTTYYTVTNYAK